MQNNGFKQLFRIAPLGFLLMSVLCFTLTLSWGSLALPQVFSQKEVPGFYKTPGINLQGDLGNLVYAPVKLDGKVLFLVAAPASVSQKKSDEELSPLEVRVQSIERKLQGILQRGFDPETLSVTASILNDQTVILVSDGQSLTPQPVLTVTNLDAQLHGRGLSDLAVDGAKYLRSVLLEAWEQRQPDYLRSRAAIAGAITVGLLLAAGLWWRLHRRLSNQLERQQEYLRHNEDLMTNLSQIKSAVPAPDSLVPQTQKNEFIECQKNRERLRVKIQQINFGSWLLNFGILFLWLFSISQMLRLFPYTRELGYFVTQKPKELLLIGLAVFLVNKWFDPLISHFFNNLKEEVELKILFNRASERSLVRIDILTDAIKGIKTFFLLAFGLIVSVQRLGIPLAPILAGAGIIGFAVSFGSQNFIKSLILGASNFWLDAYAIGDWIVVENFSGNVEKMNLFFTQIRNTEGSLITIPNSRIEIVENQTRDWSQVNLTIQVAYDTNIDRALTVVGEIAEELSHDLNWQKHILASPNLLGVDSVDHTGMQVHLLLKTQPGLQWKVSRELRRRLRHRFEQEGIGIGIPQQILAVGGKNNQKS